MSSQPSTATNSPTPSMAAEITNTTNISNADRLNPAEFTKEYLGTQPLDKLKLIKKTCGFRKKTETHNEFIEAIYEWYQKNHAPKSATATPKTRKPRAKKDVPGETTVIMTTKKRSIESNKDFLGTRTVEQLKVIRDKNNIPAETDNHSELVDIIYNWYEAKYAAENQPCSGSLVDSIRAEVAEDAAEGLSVPDQQEPTGKGKKKEKPGKMTTKRPDFSTEEGKKELEQYKQSSSSTKEALKDRVHQIHNLLRNKGIGYGFNGLKFFNVLWGLKKLEDMNLLNKLGLTEKCKFSTLHNLALENAVGLGKRAAIPAQKNRALLLGNKENPGIMGELYDKCREFLYYEMPRDIIPGDLCLFIREINSLAEAEKQLETKHQLAGKIYEYFINRDDTAISELGAYFTDRHIVNWIYTNLCSAELLDQTNPDKPNEFTIDTMVDPFGGSGGFTTGYIMRMKELLEQHNKSLAPEQHKKINWETEQLKVFHYDMNKDVLRAAALEFMCLTGTIPRTHERTQAGQDPNINYKNSFADNYNFLETNKDAKFKRIITNPPYGGDKIATSDNETKNDLIRAYIQEQLKTPNLAPEEVARLERQIYALNEIDRLERESLEEHKVKYDTCSKQLKDFIIKDLLIMEPVARQKFNDKESCSLALLMMLVDVGGEVIGVLKEGVFFDKKYSDLRRKLIELYNVTDVISIPSNAFENTTTKTSILRFLNTPGQPTTTVKFGELDVEYFTANEFDRTENGMIRLKNFAGEMKDDLVYRLVSQATKEQILAQKDCSLNGKEYANRDIVPNPGFKMVPLGEVCECKNGKQLDKKDMIPGIYNVYGGGDNIVGTHNSYNNENCIVVSGTGNYCGYTQYVSDKFWASQAFTINSKDETIKKYIFYILKTINEYIKTLSKGSAQKFLRANDFSKINLPIPENPQVLADWVSRLSAAYNTRLTKEQQSKDLEQQVMTRIREITDNEDCEDVKLGDIATLNTGNMPTHKTNVHKYLIIGGGEAQTTSYHEIYNTEPNTILCSRVGNSAGLISKYITYTWITDCCYKFMELKTSKNYLYYFLKNNQNELFKLQKKSAQPQIPKSDILNFKIKLPKNKQLITDLEPVFTQIETLKSEAAEAEKSYSGLLDELKRAAIKSMPVGSHIVSTPTDV